MYGEFLKNDSLSCLYPCTFLWRKEKYQKKHCPCSLAFGFPRADGFFGAGRNSLEDRLKSRFPKILSFLSVVLHRDTALRQPARFFRKNRPRSAALQWAVLNRKRLSRHSRS